MVKIRLLFLSSIFVFGLLNCFIPQNSNKLLTCGLRDEYLRFRNKENRTYIEKFKNKTSTICGFVTINQNDCPILYRMVKQLSEKMNLPMPTINIFSGNLFNTITSFITGNDWTSNAFVPITSLTPGFGRIIIGEQTLNCLSYNELKAVLAHELAHIYNYHILKKIGLGLTIEMIGISLIKNNILHKDSKYYLSRFILGSLILSKQSRIYEKEADITASKYIKNHKDLINAIDKLTNLNLYSLNIPNLISDFMHKNSINLHEYIFFFCDTHPSSKERDKYLKKHSK